MTILLFLSLIVAAISVIFALQNTETVEVSFLIWTFESSLALVVLISLALGALISFLASSPSMLRKDFTNRSLRKRITELESSVADQKLKLDAAEKQNAELRTPPTTPVQASQAAPEANKSIWQEKSE
jgi:lipopolysaccharide assembly protein A